MESSVKRLSYELSKLNQAQWHQVEWVVNKTFEEKAAKLQLGDPEDIQRLILRISPSLRQSESSKD